ncbi:hypothetical protein [Aquimarina sp. 2201CG14-23]|uniref:hypothetical protein n=1 Tax=Aquimarina mycalae TaxID=3040073 RepID=UPI002477EE70|nr:hypothetical protein [Aquimarina sp. 2201CG14-23]MDH7445634.1 hypothetical protein [Aquimarina sp. 2201CG14-23]
MQYVKNSPFYQEAIQELNYSFGNFYLFEGFVVGEINEDIVFTWDDHAKFLVEDLTNLYDHNGENVIYITNRVHSYAVKPSDWLKFYKSDYKMKAYGIISYTPRGLLNVLIEKLFMKNKIKGFENLSDAIDWARAMNNASKSKAS